MNNKMLKGLVEAGAVKAVSIIANGSVVHAEILTLSGDKKVITTPAAIALPHPTSALTSI